MSNFGNIIGMLGAAGKGYAEGKSMRERDDREKKRADIQDQFFAEQARAAKAANDKNDAISQAIAPTEATQVSKVGELTVGAMGPELSTKDQYRAGGSNFGTMQDAQGAAREYNKPQSMASRVSAIDPERGLRISADASRVSQEEQGVADKLFSRQVGAMAFSGNYEGLANLLSESPADGQGGKMKVGYIKSPDSKTVRFAILGDDGKPTNRGMTFGADEAGQMNMITALMGITKPETRMEHYKWMSDRNQKQQNWQSEFGLKQSEAVSTNAYRQALGAAAVAKVNATNEPEYWGDNSDKTLLSMYTRESMDGVKTIDSDGLLFTKNVALARSRSSGGDQLSSIAYAQKVDAAARKIAGNDPQKLKQEREKIIQMMRSQSTPKSTGAGLGQVAMDESTAMSILHNEYGGDTRRAQADVQSIQSELSRKELTAENRMVLQDRIRVALAASSAAPLQAVSVNAPATQAAQQQTQAIQIAPMRSSTQSGRGIPVAKDIAEQLSVAEAELAKLAATGATKRDGRGRPSSAYVVQVEERVKQLREALAKSAQQPSQAPVQRGGRGIPGA